MGLNTDCASMFAGLCQRLLRLAGLLSLCLFSLATRADQCSSWLDKAWLNEYFYGTGPFLEVFSKNAAFPASWTGWSIEVYDSQGLMVSTVALDNSTSFACTKAGKTWVTRNNFDGSLDHLSGTLGLAVLKDSAGKFVDAFAFDNTAPPAPWKSDTDNYYPSHTLSDSTNGCPTLANRLSAQASTAGTTAYQPNVLNWPSQGNKDYSRQPDGGPISSTDARGNNWYVTSLTGAGTTYTTCTTNNFNFAKTVNVTTSPPGGTVKFTLTFTNPSSSSLSGSLSIVDTLPPGLTLVSAVASNTSDSITYSTDGTTYTSSSTGATYVKWLPTDLAGGARSTLVLTASVPATASVGTTYLNTATASGSALDKTQSDSASFTVVASTTPSFKIGTNTINSCTGSNPALKPIVTITAVDQANGTGNVLTGYTGTVTLGTSSSTNSATWSKYAANGTLTLSSSGATYTFSASDNGVAKFYLTDSTAQSIDITATDATTYAPQIMNGVFSAITYASTCSSLPSISIADASVSEGNSGTKSLRFPVTLSSASASAMTVTYSTSNITATAGSDYTGATSQSLNIPANTTSTTIDIPIIGDTAYESDETFSVDLISASGAVIAGASAIGTILNDDSPTLIGEYIMDSTWTNGGTVTDSSGNGYNGTASNSASAPTGSTPAYTSTSGTQSTCSYGTFSGGSSNSYVNVTTMPGLPTGSGFTLSAWIKPSSTASYDRYVLVNNDTSNGWALKVLAGGKVSFYKANLGFNSNSVTTGTTGGTLSSDTYSINTAATLTSGAWYFVAVTVDTSAKTVVMYVYNAAGIQQSRVTASFSGTWISGNKGISIGGDSTATDSNNSFTGNMDEVRVYDGALPESYVETVRTMVRSCSGTLDHLEIQGSATGVTCLPTTLTIKACQNSSCSIPYTGGVTGTLTVTGTGNPTVTWPSSSSAFAITANSSSVATAVQVSTVGTVAFGITSPSNPAAINATTCNFSNCQYTVADAGFVFSDTSTGASANVPTQSAGVTSTVYLRAVQKDSSNNATSTAACVAALQGTTSVNLGYYCNDPAICTGSNLATIGGTAIARNDNSPTLGNGSTSGVSLTFDSNGSAPIDLAYADVGQITLYASKTLTSSLSVNKTLAGATNAFVVKPYGFAISNIKSTETNISNPAATGASGTVFVKAGTGSATGSQFTATITALAYGGATTPNFGRESTAEGVKLTPTRMISDTDLLSDGVLYVGSTAGGVVGSFSSGSTTPTNLAWSEVGVMKMTPSVGNGSYLGTGDVTGTATANIGRFIPDHFAITPGTVTPGRGTFTYFGQDGFRTAFTLTAQNSANATTANYNGAYAKLNLANWSNFGFTAAIAANGGALPAGSTLTASATAPTNSSGGTPSWSSGVASIVAKHQVGRPTALTGETSVIVSAQPHDSDNVTLSSATAVQSAGTPLRYGRLRLSNAFGSSSAALVIPVQAQYWSGRSWTLNVADSSTALPANSLILSNYRDRTGNATGIGLITNRAVTPVLAGGQGSITLTPSGAGSVDLCLDLGPDPTPVGAGVSCNSTSAGLAYLQGIWPPGASLNNDPGATATFGIYTPQNRRTIHVRELF